MPVFTTGEAGWSLQSTTIRLLTIDALRSSSSSTIRRSLSRSSASLDHPDRAVNDAGAGSDDGIGLLASQHGLGDLRRVGKVADSYLDDLEPCDGDPCGHLLCELAGHDISRASNDSPSPPALS